MAHWLHIPPGELFYNTEQYAFEDCGCVETLSGGEGYVPAGTYSSSISQEDADNIAYEAAVVLAQESLVCSPYPSVINNAPEVDPSLVGPQTKFPVAVSREQLTYWLCHVREWEATSDMAGSSSGGGSTSASFPQIPGRTLTWGGQSFGNVGIPEYVEEVGGPFPLNWSKSEVRWGMSIFVDELDPFGPRIVKVAGSYYPVIKVFTEVKTFGALEVGPKLAAKSKTGRNNSLPAVGSSISVDVDGVTFSFLPQFDGYSAGPEAGISLATTLTQLTVTPTIII